jgi:8-oxo-dGTP pyrophosphatase MutT (NUDIX family)
MITPEVIRKLLAPLPAAAWAHPPSGKLAAVLVPLILEEEPGRILFTKRSENLATHAGQIAFPGGAYEAQDRSPIDTALRETCEEIGLQPGQIELLGCLDVIRTSSGYDVTPVVGHIPWPVMLRLETAEVDATFTIPWTWFVTNGKLQMQDGCPTSYSLHYPAFEGHEVWGATAMITMDLVTRLAQGEKK